MTLVKYSTVIDFLSENEKLLLEHESFHNLILGLAYGIRDQKIETLEPLYYSLKNTENTIIASILRSHSDRPLVITEMSHALAPKSLDT